MSKSRNTFRQKFGEAMLPNDFKRMEGQTMLSKIFGSGRINLRLEATTKADVFGELIEIITISGSEFDRQELLDAVTLRESKMNTNILPGIAVPHGYSAAVPGIIGALGFSPAGIEYDTNDRKPVHLFFMLLMDETPREQHLQALSRLLNMLNSTAVSGIRGYETHQEVYDLLCRF